MAAWLVPGQIDRRSGREHHPQRRPALCPAGPREYAPHEHISMLNADGTLAEALVAAHLDLHTRFP